MAAIRDIEVPFTPREVDFFARDELVTIIPNFSLSTQGSMCPCMMGEFGPFQPNRECKVPLWLALALWKRRRCSIRAPEWMNAEYLQAVLENERQDPASFQPLPYHYQEVAHCLFTAGTQESLPREVFGDDQGRIRELISLVEKTRYNKILQGLGMMQEAAAVKLNNLSAMELNSVRAFFTGSLDAFHRYSRLEDATAEAIQAAATAEQSQPSTRAPTSEEAPPVRRLRRGD